MISLPFWRNGAPFITKKEGVHLEFNSPAGEWTATADVNRVEIMEREGRDFPEVMLRNSVKFRIVDSTNTAIWALTANEGEVLANRDLVFRKGVLVEFGEGMELETDAIEINRASKRIRCGSGLRLFNWGLPTENDSTQFAILEGDSLSATYSLDTFDLYGIKGYIPEDGAGPDN